MTAATSMAEVLGDVADYLPHDPGCFMRPKDGNCPCKHLRTATAEAIVRHLSAAGFGLVVDAKAEALEEAAAEFAARLPDGTGNGRAYNSHRVAQMLRDRAAALRGKG